MKIITSSSNLSINKIMKIKLLFLLLCTTSLVSAQRIILRDDIKDPEQLREFDAKLLAFNNKRSREKPLHLQLAKLATEQLTDEILKGNTDFAIANIYPRWKKQLSMRFGGEANFLKRARETVTEMNRQNTVITDIKVGVPNTIYYVWLKKMKNKSVIYFPFDYTTQKLVIVPTSVHATIDEIDKETGKKIKIIKNSFQIAIYDEATKSWSFISGGSISINQLRSLFPTLPMNMTQHFEKSGGVVK